MNAKVLSQVDADGNAAVVLNRPEVHNAFDPEMVDALTSTLRQLESRAEVRAIVLTGAGKNFCAGADIEQMKRSATYTREQNLELARATSLMLQTFMFSLLTFTVIFIDLLWHRIRLGRLAMPREPTGHRCMACRCSAASDSP